MRDSHAAQGTEILRENEARAEISAQWKEK